MLVGVFHKPFNQHGQKTTISVEFPDACYVSHVEMHAT